MTILKKKFRKTQEGDVDFVGMYIPKDLASYLSLYCLAHKKTKTSIVQPLLTNWVSEMQYIVPVDVLIKDIAMAAHKVWDEPVNKKQKINFSTFKFSLTNELDRKGLSKYTEQIITIIEHEKNQNEN